MEQNQQVTTKAKRGAPIKDFSWTKGHKFSAYLTGHGRAVTRFGRDGGLLSRIIPRHHVYINCSCACGFYTASYPKAIRLDHLMKDGPDATVSCGCHGKQTYKDNCEAHTIKECSPAKISSLFTAFCRTPFRIAAISKRYAVASWMVGAAYRIELKRLAGKLGDLIRAGKSYACGLGARGNRFLVKYVLRDEPPSVLELNDEDIDDPHMRFMFGLSPAFESISFTTP